MSKPDGPWTHEMVLVYRVFRRELGLAPGLVAAVPAYDRGAGARLGGSHSASPPGDDVRGPTWSIDA